MRVLVTGASGMIGMSVIERLCTDGIKVIATDAVKSPCEVSIPWHVADITDEKKLNEITADCTHVIHLAGISGPMVAQNDPDRVFRVNIDGTRNILSICKKHKISRFIFASSIMAYGPQADLKPVKENRPLLSSNMYGVSKIACEALVRAYDGISEFQGTSLRLAHVYGPRRTTSCVIGETLRAAKNNQAYSVPFGLGWSRQYIYLDDIVDAFISVLHKNELPLDCYNIGPGRLYELEKISLLLEKISDSKLLLEGYGHPFDSKHGVLDISAAGRDFDFSPRVDIESGMLSYLHWLQFNPF